MEQTGCIDHQPKVSIVVPIYDVEAYLQRCIDSILGQTIVDFELILVDDGSPDGCGAICDDYLSKDARISVIHQENGGLSSARNAGIDIARGNYLIFVDSDDWIEPEYLEVMLRDAESYQVSMVICDFISRANGDTGAAPPHDDVIEQIDRLTAIARMLAGEWISAWAKLYRRELFQNIRFPLGRINEDYAILIYLIERCDVVVYHHRPLYNYLKRANSISTEKLNTHSYDIIHNGMEIYQYTQQQYPQYVHLAAATLGASLIQLSVKVCAKPDTPYTHWFDTIYPLMWQHAFTMLRNPAMGFKLKLFFAVVLLGKRLYRVFAVLYARKKYGNTGA